MEKKSFVTKAGAPAASRRSGFFRRFTHLRGKSAASVGKRMITGAVFFAVLSAGLFLSLAFRQSRDLLAGNSGLSFQTYSDAADTSAGTSSVHVESVGNALRCNLQLGGTIADPYAGISIVPKDTVLGFIDLSGFDHINVACAVSGTHSLSVDFATFIDGITDRRNTNTARSHETGFDNLDGNCHISVPIKTATTPTWWYEQNGLLKAQLPADNPARTLSLNIGAGTLTKCDSPVSIAISRISLEYNNLPLILSGTAAALVAVLLALLAFRRKPMLLPQARHVNLGNRCDEDLGKLVAWIGDHYDDAEATVADAAKAIGVCVSQISNLIERGYRMSFKQYVTRVRLAEGTRLLRETDRNVTEIAIAVGYQYPTSFNRTFREAFSCSPTEYRKLILEKKREKVAA